jgi:GMP synthase (glutamine-hydrolysing)
MRVFAFRHAANEGLGHIQAILESRGVTIETADLYAGDPVPDLSGAVGLIFMGGAMSVNDPLPWIETELTMIRSAAARSVPVFGVCLGAQLIAKALGAEVRRAPAEEVGWFDVELTPAGCRDVLFQRVAPRVPVFQFHYETFDLPHGATLLAKSERCTNQAFQFGKASYGIQFHPEVTPEMIADWSSGLPFPVNPACHADHLAQLCETLFGGWAATL